MRVRVWHAFASNNSGSYSIVGSFLSADVATQVANELAPVVEAHSAWLRTPAAERSDPDPSAQSPLEIWALAQGLRWTHDDLDLWPQYSGDNQPRVIAAGAQLLIHEDYTVSMPGLFGELFYRRGGRVDVELNHAHHPLVAVLRFFVPWNAPDREAREYVLLALRESLDSAGSPLRVHLAEGIDLVVREISFGMFWFEVAAVFDDLVAGVAAARHLAEGAGVSFGLSLTEAWTSTPDPLTHLRTAWANDTTP